MNAEYAPWDYNQHQYDSKWGLRLPEAPIPPTPPQFAFPEQPVARLADGFGQLQLSKAQAPKTRTTPVTTRTRITRHGSNPNPIRPSSSGGEAHMIAFRPFIAPKRSESYSHPTPLQDFRNSRRWPPTGSRYDDVLSPEQADDLICAGASTFKGYWDAIPNAPGYNRFYAVMESEHLSRTDRAPFQQPAYREVSLNMTGATDSQFPWLSQEQPCMAYAFGKSAGTTTLNYWISKSGSSNPPTQFSSDVKPRKMKLLQILDRLQKLESGLDEDVSAQSQPGYFGSSDLTFYMTGS
jgi:hypothetical protein